MLKINNSFDTIIIGAGFAGIGMAIRLKQNGYNSFFILERNDKIQKKLSKMIWYIGGC